MKKMLLLLMLVGITTIAFSQTATDGDYRTKAAGPANWSDATSWQVRTATNWADAATAPTASNTVYIQSGHTITVNSSVVDCKDLQVHTSGVVSIGTNTLQVSGKLRAYTGTAVTTTGADGTFYSGQTSASSLVDAMMVSSGVGSCKIIGATRNITSTNEWGATGLSTCTLDFALTAGQIGTLGTSIKAGTVIFSSGTITTANRVAADQNAIGTGDVTIKNGATLISSSSTAGAGNQVISRTGSTRCNSVTVDLGGTLELTGATPCIDATTVTFNGNVVYSRGGTQTMVSRSSNDASALTNITPYYNLIVRTSNSKQAPLFNVTITNQLITEGTAVISNSTNTGSFYIMANGSTIVKNSALSGVSSSSTVKFGAIAGDVVNLTINFTCSSSSELLSGPLTNSGAAGTYGTLTIATGVVYTVTGGRTITNLVNNGTLSLSAATTHTTVIMGTVSGSGLISSATVGNCSLSFGTSSVAASAGAAGTINIDNSVPGTTNVFNNFIINKPTSGSVTFNGNVQFNGSVQFFNGVVSSNAAIAYGPVARLTYTSGTNYLNNIYPVSSVEWPSVNGPRLLTLANSTVVILPGSRTIADGLTVSSGTLSTGANALTFTVSAINTFGANTILDISASGSVDFAGSSVTLQSTASGTARISQTFGTLTGANNVTIQRFIPSKASRAWSLVSSPVGQLLNAGWQQQVHITGANAGTTTCTTDATTGFDITTTNAPSMFTYNASNTTGNRWTAVANTNATSTSAGTGFRMNIRGPRATGCPLLNGSSLMPAEVTLSSTGTISNAAKNLGSFTIDYPNTGTNNYVLIGNPYPSQISFSTLVADNLNMGNNYAIYAPGNTAGNYAYWDPIGGTYTGGNTGLVNATGNIIASGQAIFVRAQPVSTLTLSFNEAQKTATTPTGYFRTTNFNEMVRIAYMLDDTNKADEIIVRYSNDARINNTTIGQMDIESMNAGSQYITSLKNTKAMAVQTRSLKTLQTDTVALNVISSQNGTYKLSFSDYENFTAANIYLLDKYTNSTTAIKDNPVYSFTVDRTIAATQGQRFALVFAKAIVPQAVITGIKMYPNPANKNLTVELPLTEGKYTLRITDVIGKQVYQNQLAGGVQAINISKLAQGNYVVEITDTKGNRAVEKLVKQ